MSRPSRQAAAVVSSPGAKWRHHGMSHAGDWNGVAVRARRHSSHQAGSIASSAAAVRMISPVAALMRRPAARTSFAEASRR